MKRIYLLTTALVLGTSAFGQKHMNVPAQSADEQLGVQTDKISKTQLYNFGKAPGDVIFSETFTGGMGGFTVAAGTMDTIWKYDTDGPDGQFSSTTNADIITSTTASTGFMIFDADASNPGPAAGFVTRVGSLTSPAINMTGINNALISFESTYRSCCANGFFFKVQVSTDDFLTSQTYNVSLEGFGVNAQPPTHVKKVNVTDFLTTATNKSNFKFRFFFDGNEGTGTSHYFWQIDDVEVIENWVTDNSAVKKFMGAGTFGVPYYTTTVNQISPIVFGASALNNGSATSMGTILTTNVTGGTTASVVSPPLDIPAGALDTLETAPWTPTATAPTTYRFAHTISSSSLDQDMNDNVLLDSMVISATQYSVDNGTAGAALTNFSGQTGQASSFGNVMEIINDDWITGISISLNSTATNVGQTIKGEIWKFDAGTQDYSPWIETGDVAITAANNNTTITIPILGGPIKTFANDDLLVMQTNFGNGTTNVSVRTAQPVEPGVVLGLFGGVVTPLANPRAMRVRLNLNPTLSVSENTQNITIANLYPNPTETSTSFKFNAVVEQTASVQVVDVTGKVMFSKDLGTVNAGPHSVEIDTRDYNAGMYFVNLTSNDGVITKKLMKK